VAAVTYAYDGQIAYAPWKGRWVRVEVRTAMGDTAHCVNELHGIDTWFKVNELREAANGDS